jgi:hypothetical protein
LLFQPTYSVSAGSFAETTLYVAQYMVGPGHSWKVLVDFVGTQSTSNSDYVTSTVPFGIDNVDERSANSGIASPTGGNAVLSQVSSGGNILYHYKYDAASGAFTVGAGRRVRFSGIMPITL